MLLKPGCAHLSIDAITTISVNKDQKENTVQLTTTKIFRVAFIIPYVAREAPKMLW
jgi:hypothetical protein